MRGRNARSSGRAAYAERTSAQAWSPMACTQGCKPADATAPIRRRSSPGSVSHSPELPGSSLYGSNSFAPRLPRAPSANIFTERTVRRPICGVRAHSSICAASFSIGCCPSSMAYTRTGSRSSVAILR